MITKEPRRISLRQMIGRGYKRFWNFRGRYRVVKGSRGSKKSKTAAHWYIYNMMKYKWANLLVVRQVAGTLADSCRADLIWAIRKQGVTHLWDIPKAKLELTYKPTGQKIMFRGLDDPLKVTSVAVSNGMLSWLWVEEAYQVVNEADFDVLDESIRGMDDMEELTDLERSQVFKQITLTLNPWNASHWIKARFFDGPPDPDILAITTTYKLNEWLDTSDLRLFEKMKIRNPKRYRVAGLGEWGVTEGIIFDNWEVARVDLLKLIKERPHIVICSGLDFGFSQDPAYFGVWAIDLQSAEIFQAYELSERGLVNKALFKKIVASGYYKELITADCADPKSIEELRSYGLRMEPSYKGKDSINSGIQFLQGFKMWIDPRCKVMREELGTYVWGTKKDGSPTGKPIDSNNHGMDAMRYALQRYIVTPPVAKAFNKAAIFRRGARI